MAEITPIFAGSDGLNTVVDPVRIPFDPAKAIVSFGATLNTKVDRTGRPSRRDGYADISLGATHSLFCDKGPCVFVQDGSLYQLLSDNSTVEHEASILSRLSYAQVGQVLYYASPTNRGLVSEGSRAPWPDPGPSYDTNRIFSRLPDGVTHIMFYAGRMWASVDKFLFYSEPYAFSFFDMARSYLPFDSTIRMIKPVKTGFFVSTDTETSFISGGNPKEFDRRLVMPYPALEWSEAIDLISGYDAGIDEPGLCALWISTQGACIGTPSGVAINLTADKVIYPQTAPRGASLLRGFEFIQTMEV